MANFDVEYGNIVVGMAAHSCRSLLVMPSTFMGALLRPLYTKENLGTGTLSSLVGKQEQQKEARVELTLSSL